MYKGDFSRILTLHNDVKDIVYGCRCVYDEGKKQGLELPLFYGNMDRVFASIAKEGINGELEFTGGICMK